LSLTTMARDTEMLDAPAAAAPAPKSAPAPAAGHITFGEAGARPSAEALASAVKSGNITLQDANAETLALPAVRPASSLRQA